MSQSPAKFRRNNALALVSANNISSTGGLHPLSDHIQYKTADIWPGTTAATGGTVATSGNFKTHTFTTSGTFTLLSRGADETIVFKKEISFHKKNTINSLMRIKLNLMNLHSMVKLNIFIRKILLEITSFVI